MQLYWVVGGEYTGTDFSKPVKGREICKGPFQTYQKAKEVWKSLAWSSVDDANTRYRIEAQDPEDAPPCTD